MSEVERWSSPENNLVLSSREDGLEARWAVIPWPRPTAWENARKHWRLKGRGEIRWPGGQTVSPLSPRLTRPFRPHPCVDANPGRWPGLWNYGPSGLRAESVEFFTQRAQ